MQYWQENPCARILFSAATLFKKRLWHRGFPVNFARFLRTTFLRNTSARLFVFYNSFWLYTSQLYIASNRGGKKRVSSWERGNVSKNFLWRLLRTFYAKPLPKSPPNLHSCPLPPITYSYLPFKNSKFMVVKGTSLHKKYRSQICNFISKNRLITLRNLNIAKR